jgi:hypothetical protein
MAKKQFTDNNKRSERIQKKMEADYGKPVAFYGYFATQTEACKKLKVTPAELNKAMSRDGLVHGLKVVKGAGIDFALTKFIEIKENKKK